MKKIKLIYNPFSGDKSFRYDLDPCIQALQGGGFEVCVYRSARSSDIDEQVARMAHDNFDAVAVCGGDGSVNAAVNAVMRHSVNVPLGVIPCGTANDFASGLGIPSEHVAAAETIAAGKTSPVDIGRVNDRYFINVCAAGMLTNISQNIDINFKNTFGKLAYYIKGMEQIPGFMPIRLKITGSLETFDENVYFFCALNSTGTGGFDKLSPGASVSDGLFDFVAFKAIPLHELAVLFVKMLAGEYLDDNRVIFFRDKAIRVEAPDLAADTGFLETDIDGEAGPFMPVDITNLHKALDVFIP